MILVSIPIKNFFQAANSYLLCRVMDFIIISHENYFLSHAKDALKCRQIIINLRRKKIESKINGVGRICILSLNFSRNIYFCYACCNGKLNP